MNENDFRWMQRFSNYCKALNQLSDAVALAEKRELTELERQGLIQAFEYTHELAWNTLKDFYEYQGESGLQGSRDTVKLAFNRGLIENGEVWMDMINSRNQSSHTYNEETAKGIVNAIIEKYEVEFRNLRNKLKEL
ncbi:MAG: nucleotidyltransferase substrate binding protein [Bacteroidota bacterium]